MNRLWIVIYTTCFTIRGAAPQFDFDQQYFQIPSMSGLPNMPFMSGIQDMLSMSGMQDMLSMPGMLQLPSISQTQSLSAIPSTGFYSSNPFGSISSSVYENSGHWSRHHKHKTSKKESYEIDYDESSDLTGECRCSCNKCDRPKPCCIPVCEQCNMIGAKHGSIMLVPYAYPVFLTHPPDQTETTQLPATTEKESNYRYNNNEKDYDLRTILNEAQDKKTNSKVNNELDDVDLRIMKIIKMVQSVITTKSTQTPTKTIPTITTRKTKSTPAQKTKTTTTKTQATTTTTASTITTTTTSTTPATEEITITTTDAPVTEILKMKPTLPKNRAHDDELYRAAHHDNKHHRYILTSMRRMKENYLPKYGVVPIPNEVAERLLQKIRSMRLGSARTKTSETSVSQETSYYNNIPLNTRVRSYQNLHNIE